MPSVLWFVLMVFGAFAFLPRRATPQCRRSRFRSDWSTRRRKSSRTANGAARSVWGRRRVRTLASGRCGTRTPHTDPGLNGSSLHRACFIRRRRSMKAGTVGAKVLYLPLRAKETEHGTQLVKCLVADGQTIPLADALQHHAHDRNECQKCSALGNSCENLNMHHPVH